MLMEYKVGGLTCCARLWFQNHTSSKHGNVYVFSHNPINLAAENEDFVNESQDMRMLRKMGFSLGLGGDVWNIKK